MSIILKRLFTILLGVLFSMNSYAQFLLPNFGTPEKLDALNSYAEESMPLSCMDGNRLFFLRTYLEDMDGRTEGQDIWYADRDENGNWGKPTSFLRSSSPRINDAIIGISSDANTIFVFHSEYKKRTLDQELMYTTKQEDGKWSDLKALDVPGLRLDEGYYSFYMTPDEEVLVAAIAPPDTNSFEDLYVSLKGEDDKWSELIYMGDVINTPDYELTPFLANDKKTLYFASNGHEGLGESDVFVSYRLDNTWKNWTKPLNMGTPINSDGFDAYFTIGNKKEVFFTSNRGQDYSDIYMATLQDGVKFVGNDEYVLVKGKFIFNKLPADGVTISIFNTDGELIDQVITDEAGAFAYTKLNPDAAYFLKVEESDDSSYGNAKIYVVDDNNNLHQRYAQTKDGTYVLNSNKGLYASEVYGKYAFKKLPGSNTGLVLYDENDFPVDTIYTDGAGRFVFKPMQLDENYYIAPLAISEDDYQYANVTFTDKFDQTIYSSDLNGKNGLSVNASEMKKAKENFATKLAKSGVTVYFSFNNTSLSKREKSEIDMFIGKLSNKSAASFTVTGHTDNIDGLAINLKVSRQRAAAVKAYLMELGISEEAITTLGEGETKPIASNETKEGRKQNRRVEIKLN